MPSQHVTAGHPHLPPCCAARGAGVGCLRLPLQIEAIESVERAFVHVDYRTRSIEEHKVGMAVVPLPVVCVHVCARGRRQGGRGKGSEGTFMCALGERGRALADQQLTGAGRLELRAGLGAPGVRGWCAVAVVAHAHATHLRRRNSIDSCPLLPAPAGVPARWTAT